MYCFTKDTGSALRLRWGYSTVRTDRKNGSQKGEGLPIDP